MNWASFTVTFHNYRKWQALSEALEIPGLVLCVIISVPLSLRRGRVIVFKGAATLGSY